MCGLQRDGSGKLNFGSDGLPVPICVASTDANAAACGRPGIKPQPASFIGGSGGSQGWTAVQLSGIFHNGSSAGVIASIGSDAYSGGPAYFAGNGSDATVVVKGCRTFSPPISPSYSPSSPLAGEEVPHPQPGGWDLWYFLPSQGGLGNEVPHPQPGALGVGITQNFV